MASQFGRKFYDLLRIHIETGIPSSRLDLKPELRKCIDIVDDLYEHWRHNPSMNTSDYIQNKYDIKDYSRIYKLNKALNFVCSLMSSGLKDMQRYKANAYVDRMLKIGDATGDWKPMDKAIAHLTKINGLDQPDPAENIEDQIPKMGYLLTTKASDVNDRAVDHTPAQIAAMFKHYGVKKDIWQQLLEDGKGTADNYNEDGDYIRKGKSLVDVEDAEILQLEEEFAKEVKEDEEHYRKNRGYSE